MSKDNGAFMPNFSEAQNEYIDQVAQQSGISSAVLKINYTQMLMANFEQDINDLAKDLEAENEDGD